MNWYPYIKQYYDEGLYTKQQLRIFVSGHMITPDQYTQICGEPYDEPTSTAPQSQASAANSTAVSQTSEAATSVAPASQTSVAPSQASAAPSQASTAISAAPTASTAI